MSRIQNCMPAVSRCVICEQQKQTHVCDLDLRGFICDDCEPALDDAEHFLTAPPCRGGAGLIPPTDELIEEHL